VLLAHQHQLLSGPTSTCVLLTLHCNCWGQCPKLPGVPEAVVGAPATCLPPAMQGAHMGAQDGALDEAHPDDRSLRRGVRVLGKGLVKGVLKGCSTPLKLVLC